MACAQPKHPCWSHTAYRGTATQQQSIQVTPATVFVLHCFRTVRFCTIYPADVCCIALRNASELQTQQLWAASQQTGSLWLAIRTALTSAGSNRSHTECINHTPIPDTSCVTIVPPTPCTNTSWALGPWAKVEHGRCLHVA